MRNLLSPLLAAGGKLVGALWFLPAGMVLMAVLAALMLVLVNPDVSSLETLSPRLFSVSPEGARGVLTAIATAMLSVAGVVFSITIATLSLTSQQFSSRVLRTFVHDRGNQTVLGVFLGSFAYSLIVLRAVSDPSDGEGFVPQLAVLVAIVFALLGAAVLIYFINHVASSIQASTIISRIARQTVAVLRAGREADHVDELEELRWEHEKTTVPVLSSRSGYVAAVDLKVLGRLSQRHSKSIRVETNVGGFVVEGEPLVSFLDGGGDPLTLAEKDGQAIRRAFRIEVTRDIHGDPGFGVRQLVDIAVRALSPGVNDTTTAVICVDYLAAVLIAAEEHAVSNRVWRSSDGVARVFARGAGFEELLNKSFDQIRDNAEGNLAVLLRQLETLQHLGERVTDPSRRRLLVRHVQLILEAGGRGLSAVQQRRLLANRVAELIQRLQAGSDEGKPTTTTESAGGAAA